MMTQNADKKREQIQMFCMDDLVPQDHLLRLIDQAIDWSFIYDLVIDKYSADNGRPSMDPVMLIKIPFIQYLYGIRSMRQTVKEIEVNVAYRWFLGLEMMDKVPHFSTFGKNYTRRFKDTDLFEQIFSRILQECYKYRLIDPSEVFVDATHVKARIPLYTDDRKSPDGNESRAYVCLHESEKLAKMIARKGKRGAQKCLLLIKYTLFEPKTRKTLLEC